MSELKELQAVINNAGLAEKLTRLHSNFATMILDKLSNNVRPTQTKIEQDQELLAQVGDVAASEAVQYAISACVKRGELKTVESTLNGSITHNLSIVRNAPGDGYQNFSNVLRQFLLPRYAYLDFDRVVDPRHLIDEECGYPKWITPIMYRYMYDRDDVARRVNDIYPDECWAADPLIYETEDEEQDTPFEQTWRYYCDNHFMLQMLYRMDKLCGIGHYGALLLGIDDGADLEKPIDGITAWGTKDPAYKGPERHLLYMRPFDEYLSFVQQYETDVMNPRYGKPKFYNLIFLDMTIDAAGASIGTRLNRRVHWTRVVHIADNLQSSLVFGIPRMQPVFNRLLDLRKIKSSSAEMFWKGAFPGLSFEVDPRFVADNPEFNVDEFRKEVEDYANGLQRIIRTMGVKVTSLAPNITDPKKHVEVQLQAIFAHYGVPLRIALGSESSRLASGQDKLTWNQRLGRRNRMFTEPFLIRQVIDRFVAIGLMPPPMANIDSFTKMGKYFVGWDDLNKPTDEDKANLALKWTQAVSQYVASGMIHLIPPTDFFTTILGLPPAEALRIVAEAEKAGGFKKLMDVDPSQGAGVNGVRENIASKDGGGHSSTKAKKRDSNQKQVEGKTS